MVVFVEWNKILSFNSSVIVSNLVDAQIVPCPYPEPNVVILDICRNIETKITSPEYNHNS